MQIVDMDYNPRKNVQLYKGKVSFTILQVFGTWRPTSWDSQRKIWIYAAYSVTIITMYIFTILFFLISLLQGPIDKDSYTLCMLYFWAGLCVLIKMINILLRRETLIKAQNLLESELCQARDFKEEGILKKYSKISRLTTISILCMLILTVVAIVFAPFTQRNKRLLPVKIWTPYSLDNNSAFLLTYLCQGFFFVVAGVQTANVETLALIITLQICAQIEIIACRLQSLAKLHQTNDSESVIYGLESKIIKDCVTHHIYIYLLGEKFNQLFGLAIVSQFFASSIDMCIALYHLSRFNFDNGNSWVIVPVQISLLLQIFVYCFCGEQLTEKSLMIMEEVYTMNWLSVTTKTKKDLILIMLRASRPIKVTGASMILMSYAMFLKVCAHTLCYFPVGTKRRKSREYPWHILRTFSILKIAYSAFNLLNRF